MEINVSIAVVFIVHSCIYIYIYMYHVVISWRLYYINGGLMMEY